ncbi:unnamed protein product, partial [marine sediment metagenome]
MANKGYIDINNKKVHRIDYATHWQLMLWKFRKNRMALIAVGVLGIFLIISLFAEFIAPYKSGTRNINYLQGPPIKVHLLDDKGNFHFQPFIYEMIKNRDPVTFRVSYITDTSKQIPIRFFTRGETYRFWGLFESNFHLFGADKGFINLFGTDQLGRDLFSRIMYATRISLSVGAIGVFFVFILGLIMGGIAGYLGGLTDELIMRLMEFIRSIPTLPLWLALAAALPREWSSLKVYLAVTIILASV